MLPVLPVLLLALTPLVWGQNRILYPLEGKEGADVGLVIVPGALLEYTQYRTIAQELQELSSLRLWCFLADGAFRRDAPTSAARAEEDTTLGQAKARLNAAGMPQEAPIFGAGHSLGGVVLQGEVEEYPNLARGLALWGGVPLSPPEALPIPTLTLQGDLDGLNRITTVASQFYLVKQAVEGGEEDYKTRYPYKVMVGVNHAQYATGDMPDLVVEYDLPSELADNVARYSINQAMDDFLDYYMLDNEEERLSAEKNLQDYYLDASAYLTPLIEMFNLEESETGATSSWVEQAQRLLADLPDDQDARLTSLSEVVDDFDLAVRQPELEESQDGTVTVLSLVTVTRPFFELPTPREAALILETKMKSRAGIQMALGSGSGSATLTCKELNQAAWDLALSTMPALNRARWDATGIKLDFQEDEESFWGPGWLGEDLKFEFSGGVLSIQSASLYTEDDFFFDYMHFCKLLSPARAMEYMYIEGIRDGLLA